MINVFKFIWMHLKHMLQNERGAITISRGGDLPDSSAKSDFHNLIDSASIAIGAGTIVNADVNASAAIALSKLATSGAYAPTGDWTPTGDFHFNNAATTDTIVKITADSLTTGAALLVDSDSDETDTRNLVQILNDNAAADATTPLQIKQDGDACHINLTGDPSNTTPIDGDIWYDGTDFKGYNGSSTSTFNSRVIQVVETGTGTFVDLSPGTAFTLDDTPPVNSEGAEAFTLAITPSATTNKLLIESDFYGGHASGSATLQLAIALYQDSTATALAISLGEMSVGVDKIGAVHLSHYMAAGTTAETTFKIRASFVGNTEDVNQNGHSDGRMFGGKLYSGMRITEVLV